MDYLVISQNKITTSSLLSVYPTQSISGIAYPRKQGRFNVLSSLKHFNTNVVPKASKRFCLHLCLLTISGSVDSQNESY